MRLKNENSSISIDQGLAGHMLTVQQIFEIKKEYPNLDILEIRDAVFSAQSNQTSNIESIFKKKILTSDKISLH